MGISLVAVIAMQAHFFTNTGLYQLAESWGGSQSGINLIFSVDGISQPMMLVTPFLFLISALYSVQRFRTQATAGALPEREKLFWQMLLALHSIVLIIFSTQNVIVFFIAWELFLLPVVVLTYLFGLEERKKAALKFFLYTFISSGFLIIGLIGIIYFQPRLGVDFDIRSSLVSDMQLVPPQKQALLFWCFMIAFLVKMPVFPWHAWLPLTHTQAPIQTLLLSGLFLKLGTYGILRFVIGNFGGIATLMSPMLIKVGLFTMLFGALVAWRQKSFRYVIAYSSLAHMGLLLAGIFALNADGMAGAIFQNFSHSLVNALLFVIVGIHLSRNQTDDLSQIRAPQSFIYWFAFSIAIFSAIGVPGTSGFIGEFLMFLGLSRASWPSTVVALAALILGAIYMLRLFHKVRGNPPSGPEITLSGIEKSVLIALSTAILYFGIFPSLVADGAHSQARATTFAPVMRPGAQ